MYKLFAFVLIILGTVSQAGTSKAASLPSNGRIAFASNQDGDYEIYTINADGTDVQQLTFNLGYDDQPVWSPDGTKLLFSSDRDGEISVFVMNADGSDPVNLTPDLGSFDARWSPDGKQIAFTVKSENIGENISVMNADGSQKTNLTHDTVIINAMPIWSRDGKQIFFITTREYASGNDAKEAVPVDVFVMNADGSDLIKVFGAGIGITSVNLSPDGASIIYGVWRLGPTLIIRDLESNHEHILIDGVTASGSDPAWSPDGSKIVFNRDSFTLATMDKEGHNLANLLTVKPPSELSHPDWQPMNSNLQNQVDQ